MIKINLLDWREAQRQQRQKNFFTALAITAALGAAVVFGINTKVQGDISHQNARNNLLKSEIKQMDNLIKEIDKLEKVKADLLARMQIIEELQRSRTRIVHFFDQIVTTAPAGLHITQLEQKNKQTRIKGVAESNGRVSTYIRNIDGSDWFHQAKLIVIETRETERRKFSDFELNFKDVPPAGEEDSE